MFSEPVLISSIQGVSSPSVSSTEASEGTSSALNLLTDSFRTGRAPTAQMCALTIAGAEKKLPLLLSAIEAIKSNSSSLEDISSAINDLEKGLRQIDSTISADLKNRAKTMTGIDDTMVEIRRIVTAEEPLGLRFRPKIFRGHDLDTVDGLGEQECDQLVEDALEMYGHRNHGKNLGERRDCKRSSWEVSYVPPSVLKLVSYRGVAVDSVLDAEKVRPLLLEAQREIIGHSTLEDFRRLARAFEEEMELSPAKVLEIWDKHGEEPAPVLIKALRDRLLEAELWGNSSEELNKAVETVARLREVILSPLKAREAILREEAELNTVALRCEKADLLLSDPLATRKWGPDNCLTELETALRYGSDGAKDTFLAAIVSQASESQDYFRVLIEHEKTQFSNRLATKTAPDYDDIVSSLTRLVAAVTYAKKEPLHQALTSLRNDLPTWATEWLYWRANIQTPEGEFSPPIRALLADLRRELVAWGRMRKEPVPLVPILSSNGLSIRRGLSEKESSYLQ